MTTTKDAGKVKGKAMNDFNLAAMGKNKRDNSGSPDPNKGVTPPGPSPHKEASRLKKGAEIHMKSIRPKGPEPGR